MGKIDEIMIHDDTYIHGFFREYRWLSNFHLCEVEYGGIIYPSTENAYQAQKTNDHNLQLEFAELTPSQSKIRSHQMVIPDDWELTKMGIMNDLLRLKFAIPELRDMLLATDNKHIEETNYWNDSWWGVCEGVGKNVLGKLIMNIRSELRGELPKYKLNMGFSI